MEAKGYCASGFEEVRQAFEAIFDNPAERGAGLCVQVEGETIVDLWAGVADLRGRVPWQRDTLVNAYCVIKPVTAVAALMLVEEGRLGLDVPVCAYWPEFAQNGKERITLRQVLCHTSGLPALRLPDRTPIMYDWEAMVETVAAEPAWWAPGMELGYGATTYGWVLGELIRRVDGRDSQTFIQERITRPQGLEVHVGVAAEDFQRIAHFEYAAGRQGERYARELREIIVNRPGDVATLAFTNPSMSSKNTSDPRWWSYHQPGACSHATAHGLAGFYSALLGGRFIGAELLRDFLQEQSCGIDRTLCRPMRYGLGCMLENAADPAASYRMGQKAFGHVGLGGPVAFADPERNLSFAFVTTTMGGHVLMDPRPRALAERCYAAL
ncbi:serine hydrolase domain-containing protein [Pseudomonas aeruginosa]|uniref:serine hydrolase domain-containing protein n=1 Tax=Pseudomonas aeruginosa TaxID=287 RepID=UPI0022EAE751|nr:serine hydrolase domain-containing protein [Pseudomonas aeruginosa]MDA3425354.1 beta-lactamase family protein [Pseudomonas aeruginosa]